MELTQASVSTETNPVHIRRDCARLLLRNARPANIAALAVSLALATILIFSTESNWPLAWLGLMLVATGTHFLVWRGYHRCKNGTEENIDMDRWLSRYTFATLLVGVGWASSLLLMTEVNNTFAISMIYIALFAVMAGAVPLLSAVPQAFHACTLPPVFGVAASCLFNDAPFSLVTGFVGIVFFALATGMSRNAHKRLVETLTLQHQNKRLIDKLNAEIERHNSSQQELDQYRHDLEEIVQQRTQHLSETNRDLEFEINERIRIVDNLKHLVHHDALTNLPNRLLLDARLKHAIERAHRSSLKVAVLFLDMDNFKNINDSLGHEIGDILLRHIASQLQSCVREDDTVARLGGDEFVIIIEQVHNVQHVRQLAGKLLLTVAEEFNAKDHIISSSASMGISLFPDHGDKPETLIKCADDAMYKAKESGRHNYQFYTSELSESAYDRVMLANSLRQAIEQQQLSVYYQPQFRLSDRRMTGAEALVRWLHPDLGLLSPDDFLRTVEDTGLMFAMGEFVIRSACEQIRQWRDDDADIDIVSVNLSGSQVRNPDLIPVVRNILNDTGCDPEWLELEISEDFIMKETEQCIDTLAGLHGLGVSLAIDDFGIGYSSLSHLRRLPINKLKIDRSFVGDIARDMDSAAIVQAIIAMGHSLNLEIVANGVENGSQEVFLKAQHCEIAQGYFYARPMSAEAITDRRRQTECGDSKPKLIQAGTGT